MSILLANNFRITVRRWRLSAYYPAGGIDLIGNRQKLASQACRHSRKDTDSILLQPAQRPPRTQVHQSENVAFNRQVAATYNHPPHQAVKEGGEALCQEPRTPPKLEATTTVTTPQNSTTTRWADTSSKVTTGAKIKQIMKKYGPVAVSFHASVFLTTLGSFYGLIDYGLDVASLVKNVPIIAHSLPHPGAGNIALAWALTTVTGPFRGVITVTLTPSIARLWRGGHKARRKPGVGAGKNEQETH